jgi:hypothetical protein
VDKKLYIGIDPGKKGAIALLTNSKLNLLEPMPPSPADVLNFFLDNKLTPKSCLLDIEYIIEEVHSMPTDGVASAFSFGRHIGTWDMFFAILKINPTRVRPQVWQEHFNMKKDKEESRYQYKKRLVDKANTIARVEDRGKFNLDNADAYLIARWRYENDRKINNRTGKEIGSTKT